MSEIALIGGTIITPLETRFSNLKIVDGKIAVIGDQFGEEVPGTEVLDVTGCYLTPGLVDLQVNGGARCNFWGDPTAEEVDSLSDDLLKAGVTCILPTLISDDLGHLAKNIKFLKSIGVGSWENARRYPSKAAKAVRRPGPKKDRVLACACPASIWKGLVYHRNGLGCMASSSFSH